MLGLPQGVRACIFELEGVLAGSARIHAAAWAETLDEFLSRRVEKTGERFAPYRPFDPRVDYERHIHGKPRLEGVLAFLASRGIRLPEGRPSDSAGVETVWGLATRKNEALLRRLDREGVSAFAGARVYLEGAREAGLSCAVVSASANTTTILKRAGLADVIAAQVDGVTIESQGLRGKPAPDLLLAACALLGVRAEDAATFETTLAGVEAGRDAGIGLVIAIDRRGREGMFRAHGADLVVPDLTALLDRSIRR
jgi:HAD superfamily hydrolase (TIGR01509 family)